MSSQPEFSISSERAIRNSRSHLPVRRNPANLDDDDAVNQRSESSADAQPSPTSPSTSSSKHKIDDVATAPTGLPFTLSLTLQNTGSVARDHLASERTFLAYVRTSLSFASAGVGASSTTFGAIAFGLIIPSALVQLFRVSVSTSANGVNSGASAAQYARPLGATLIGLGITVLGMGTLRYFAIQRALPLGLFPAARLSIFFQGVSLAALIGVVFGILVAVH